MKPSTQPIGKENKENRQVTTLFNKISRVSGTTHTAILAAFATIAMSGCSNTDEMIAPQTTSALEIENEREQEYQREEHQREQEYQREQERELLYEKQKNEEIEIRLSTARRENLNLTEMDIQRLEYQFDSEIDIARTFITLEPRLLLLNKRGTTPELKELVNETLKKLLEIVDLTGEDGSGITAPLSIMDESAIHQLTIKESELNSDISLIDSISTQLLSLSISLNNWNYYKGLIDQNTWLERMQSEEEIDKLHKKWRSFLNNHPMMQLYRGKYSNLGNPATPEASPEQR